MKNRLAESVAPRMLIVVAVIRFASVQLKCSHLQCVLAHKSMPLIVQSICRYITLKVRALLRMQHDLRMVDTGTSGMVGSFFFHLSFSPFVSFALRVCASFTTTYISIFGDARHNIVLIFYIFCALGGSWMPSSTFFLLFHFCFNFFFIPLITSIRSSKIRIPKVVYEIIHIGILWRYNGWIVCTSCEACAFAHSRRCAGLMVTVSFAVIWRAHKRTSFARCRRTIFTF